MPLIADRNAGNDMHDRHEQMRGLLRIWRGRLLPADVNLPAGRRRRVPGLRSMEVAELANVSPGWYEQFESGTSERNFSPSFVQRVAAALRLNADERATLFRLALPEVASAAHVFESNARDGAVRYISLFREFVDRLTAAVSFEEASRATVEACQQMLAPTCATVASIENSFGPPRTFAAGPRSAYVGPWLGQRILDTNRNIRAGDVVTRDVPEADRRRYNGRLQQRSELTTGLFAQGRWRGAMSCSWTEPRTCAALEIATLETLGAMLALGAVRYADR